MAGLDVSVRVQGLAELKRELKRAGPESTARFKEANVEVAENVVSKATSKAASVGGIAAKVVSLGALKARKSAANASVNLKDVLVTGGKGATFGAEFGSTQHTQFRAWRGADSNAGYFLYPTIRDEAETTEQLYGDALDRLMQSLNE